MKIALDARGANWYSGTGIGTYTSHIVKYLLKNDKDNSYLLYWCGMNYNELNYDNLTVSIASKKHHRFFEETFIPVNLKKRNIDIYHVPQNGIGLPSQKSCIYISTIHDLIPYVMPETVGRSYLKKFISQMPEIIDNSKMIITVSEFSKMDIMKIFNVPEDLIKVTPLAAENDFKPMDKVEVGKYLKSKYNITFPYILYIGGFSPRKNVKSILIAFSRVYKNLSKDFKVVIVGQSKDEHAYLIKLCESLEIIDKVIFTGYTPYEDLPYFYNGASLFVYPSFYEGFGLPPLEAMSCGTPVITSNVSSIPEVVGDAAVLINPFDTEELKNAIGKILEDENLQNTLSLSGLNRAKDFSWEKTAQKTLEIYKEAYEKFK